MLIDSDYANTRRHLDTKTVVVFATFYDKKSEEETQIFIWKKKKMHMKVILENAYQKSNNIIFERKKKSIIARYTITIDEKQVFLSHDTRKLIS